MHKNYNMRVAVQSVKISAYLSHRPEEVVASLVADGFGRDVAERLVSDEYAERARLDALDRLEDAA